MKVIGYSERGLLNSLFYEIKYNGNNLLLLNKLLSLVHFPELTIPFQISDAKILIEQSFSDFGDSDVLLLVSNKEEKQAYFIEAKVGSQWSIFKQFEKFKNGISVEKGMHSSNLFAQLYSKVRLVDGLNTNKEKLQSGLTFPKCSSKGIRKIGKNKVVLTAIDLLETYCKNSFFVALVPNKKCYIEKFYQEEFKECTPEEFEKWDISHWGFLFWDEIEEFCRDNQLQRTIENFEFNEGQIYTKK
jgi:hypothetical protein